MDNPTRTDLQYAVNEITIDIGTGIDIVTDREYYECEVIDQLLSRSSDQVFIEILGKFYHY